MIPHVVLSLAYQRERMAFKYSSSNSYIVLQWCSDTISKITSAVICVKNSVLNLQSIYSFKNIGLFQK